MARRGAPIVGCTKAAPQGVQANAKIPTVEKWNLAIEQQLTRTISLRVGYVGSFGYHQVISIDPNSIAPQICSNPAGCTAGGVASSGLAAPVSAQSTVPVGTTFIPVGTRPNPNLGAGFFWYTVGTSSYNALQLDVTKRFTRRMQFRANYTWSKESGHKLGADRGSGKQRGADGPGPIQFAERLGAIGARCN